MAEEIGDGWSDNAHPDDRNYVVTVYREAFERREPFEAEVEQLGQECRGLDIEIEQLDLEGLAWPLADRAGLFDAMVVTNYLYRPYLQLIPDLLVEGGVLIYETFAHGNAAFGKPSNPDFLLQNGELLDFAARHNLHVLAYEDLYEAEPKPAMVQRLCAVKGKLKERHPLQFKG